MENIFDNEQRTTMQLGEVKQRIEELAGLTVQDLKSDKGAHDVFKAFKTFLNDGKARAAEKKDGTWQAANVSGLGEAQYYNMI